MSEPRKLKRGLKDISSIFHSLPVSPLHPLSLEPESEIPASAGMTSGKEPLESSLQVLSVFSPDVVGDSLFLNTFLAAELARRGSPCSILSIHSRCLKGGEAPSKTFPGGGGPLAQESLGTHLNHRLLFWDEFEAICRRPVPPRFSNDPLTQIFFLDFEYPHAPHVEKVVPVLDKWIFFFRPFLESFSEAYKVMKAASPLNGHLEYFFLFAGLSTDPRAPLLYENFSGIVSKYLGISLSWLGSLDLQGHSTALAADLALDRLLTKSNKRIDASEKILLAERGPS